MDPDSVRGFPAEVRDVLYPRGGDDVLRKQYAAISSLIDDVLRLATEVGEDAGSTQR